jgi:type IV pilus assembly protein PilA
MLRKIRESQQEEGFTLIELLVVVIIIGILAAIAIPVFLSQRERAWTAAVESDLRNAAVAMETYYTDNGDYNVADAVALEAFGFAQTTDVSLTGWPTTANAQAYCLAGAHTNLTANPVAIYDSANGGLERGGTC